MKHLYQIKPFIYSFVIKLSNNGSDRDYVDENIYPDEIFKFVKNKLVKYD